MAKLKIPLSLFVSILAWDIVAAYPGGAPGCYLKMPHHYGISKLSRSQARLEGYNVTVTKLMDSKWRVSQFDYDIGEMIHMFGLV